MSSPCLQEANAKLVLATIYLLLGLGIISMCYSLMQEKIVTQVPVPGQYHPAPPGTAAGQVPGADQGVQGPGRGAPALRLAEQLEGMDGYLLTNVQT